MARPQKQLDWDQIEKLCQIMCTHEEIGHIVECCVETLDNACKRDHNLSFSEYYYQKASKGKISLRRKQWDMALKGDRVMLIWLGKQHLNQVEKVEQTQNIQLIEQAKQISAMPKDELLKVIEAEVKALKNE